MPIGYEALVDTGTSNIKPWSRWATFWWAFLVFAVSQAAGATIVFGWFSHVVPLAADPTRFDGVLVALVTLVTNPIQIVLLAAIARLAGWKVADYLGLVGFRLRDFLFAVVAMLALMVTLDIVARLAGHDLVPPFQREAFTSARNAGLLAMLALAVIIVGPAGEELLFRGFLFRGWVQPGPQGMVAVTAISLLWTALHLQYDWFGMLQVFLVGLLLGWIRWRSGSTTLTILLHALANLEATVETFLRVGVAS